MGLILILCACEDQVSELQAESTAGQDSTAGQGTEEMMTEDVPLNNSSDPNLSMSLTDVCNGSDDDQDGVIDEDQLCPCPEEEVYPCPKDVTVQKTWFCDDRECVSLSFFAHHLPTKTREMPN